MRVPVTLILWNYLNFTILTKGKVKNKENLNLRYLVQEDPAHLDEPVIKYHSVVNVPVVEMLTEFCLLKQNFLIAL